MCGRRSATRWLGSALLFLLCSASLSALDYDGPTLPAGWLPIHETELEALQTILDRQDETLARQETTIDRLGTTTLELERSFETFANEAAETISRLDTELWITRGVAAGLAALVVYLVIR